MRNIKLGSLFDGIGVFPLAAARCHIVPVWASEIEKVPMSITKRHFRNTSETSPESREEKSPRFISSHSVLPVKISRLQAVVRAYREVSPLCFLKRSES